MMESPSKLDPFLPVIVESIPQLNPVLPAELCDLIIDEVHRCLASPGPSTDLFEFRQVVPCNESVPFKYCIRLVVDENRTLEACAMVCWRWLQRCRALQFEIVDFSKVTQFLQEPGAPSHSYARNRGLTSLLNLTLPASETITPHIRQLKLGMDVWPLERSKDFLRIAPMHNLEFLSIDSYWEPPMGPIHFHDMVTALGSLTNLKKLKLTRTWTLQSFEQLRDMLGACRRLEHLVIRKIQSKFYKDRTSLYQPRLPLSPPTLSILTLVKCAFETQLLTWLASSAPFLPIDSLRINLEHFIKHRTPCRRLLHASSLKHLAIQCDNSVNYGYGVQFEGIDLRSFAKLETLTLWDCTPVMVHAIVEQISSRDIQELNIDASKMNMGDESMRILAVVDNIVQRPNFAHLKGLNILGGTDVVQASFPRSAARGIFQILDRGAMGLRGCIETGGPARG
ncbi:hypothetical protein HWV62_28212 [Athelia sp. TMB]|nr:hypothetical protein HWV62_28212 [Athelia sp. TMB]